jgi:hypothetical protein
MSTPQLQELAAGLASDGFAGHELAVRQVVRAARAVGPARVSTTLVDVLADPSGPEVARLRAFGQIAVTLSTVTDHVTGHDAVA